MSGLACCWLDDTPALVLSKLFLQTPAMYYNTIHVKSELRSQSDTLESLEVVFLTRISVFLVWKCVQGLQAAAYSGSHRVRQNKTWGAEPHLSPWYPKGADWRGAECEGARLFTSFCRRKHRKWMTELQEVRNRLHFIHCSCFQYQDKNGKGKLFVFPYFSLSINEPAYLFAQLFAC